MVLSNNQNFDLVCTFGIAILNFFESGVAIVMCNELTERKIDRTQAMNKG